MLGTPDLFDPMLSNRVGTFFIIMGIAFVALYILSDVAKTPTCSLLFIGGIALGLGILLMRRNPGPPPKETGRFRILRGSEKKQGKK